MPAKIVKSPKFKEFLTELEIKMRAGVVEHGESKHGISALVDEITDEALDFCGWGFLAWKKAKKLQAKILKIEKELLKLKK